MAGKQTKAEHRGATRIEAVRPRPQQPLQWPLLTIRALTSLGLLVSIYLTVLHIRAGIGGTIDSPFCSAGSTINCNAVLGSAYARLFNIPVAGWAAATYGATLVVSFLAQPALLVFLCGWTFAFSLYMASLSLFVIKSACLFCITLYIINTGILIGAITLARSLALFTGQQAFFNTLAYAVIIGGIGWLQSQTAAEVIATTAPIAAPVPAAIDEGFLKFYNSQKIVTVTGEERNVEGPPQALLTISEFADLRCPECARARKVLRQLREGNPNDIRVIFYHYPLDSQCNPGVTQQVHSGSCAASIAAECAGDQGKFWEYADLLFANQKERTRSELEQDAGKLNLDLKQFQACLDDVQIKDRLRKDMEEAEKIGVKGTPTFVMNGHLIEGLPTANKIASLITVERQRLGKK